MNGDETKDVRGNMSKINLMQCNQKLKLNTVRAAELKMLRMQQ